MVIKIQRMVYATFLFFHYFQFDIFDFIKAIIVARSRPHAPSENSLVIGTIVRLTSQQAVVSISVVDGIPLPDGEDYTGIIRTQDVRMTEKDKVKIGDCFRNGDVVRGIVVSMNANSR